MVYFLNIKKRMEMILKLIIIKGHVKKLVFMFLFIFISTNLFPYDGTLLGGYDGNMTRFQFIQEANDIALAQDLILDQVQRGQRLERFFLIGPDDVDEEDVLMINNHIAYLQQNFRINNGDAFAYIVMRSFFNNNSGGDGWLVYSHYSSSQGWLSCIYYFLIR